MCTQKDLTEKIFAVDSCIFLTFNHSLLMWKLAVSFHSPCENNPSKKVAVGCRKVHSLTLLLLKSMAESFVISHRVCIRHIPRFLH